MGRNAHRERSESITGKIFKGITERDIMKGKVKWTGDMKLLGECDDKSIEIGGENLTPMQMLLLSAAGCTSLDIVYILKKSREPIEGLEVEISGERRKEHPKYFTKMTLNYKLKGNLSDEKVLRAIKLSQDKYCSALGQMKIGGIEVDWDHEILK